MRSADSSTRRSADGFSFQSLSWEALVNRTRTLVSLSLFVGAMALGPFLRAQPAFKKVESSVPAAGEVYILVNTASGRCLSVLDGNVVQGPFPKAAGPVEQWKAVGAAGASFRLVNQKSGKVLAVPASSKEEGQQLIEWDDLKLKDQRWEFVKVGKHYSLKSRISGMVAAVGASSKDEHAPVIQYRMAEIPDQIWYVRPAAGKGK